MYYKLSMPLASIVMTMLMFSACASSEKADLEAVSYLSGAADSDLEGEDEAPSAESQTIEKGIVSVDAKQRTTPERSAGDEEVGEEISHATSEQIPLEINERVEQWIQYFTTRDRERFQRFLERGERYKPMITAVLKDQEVPTELFYLAMIESGFSTHALSSAKAMGVWQFMPATGRRYGLRVDRYVDERRDPMRATIAAALYLKDLHRVFQSWYLAMAAYNAGEGRILGAVMNGKSRDFWDLVKKNALPSETMHYIPKFIAATTVGHNLAKYGFDDASGEALSPVTAVSVPSPLNLADLAKVTGVPHEVLKEHNPHILRGITPPNVEKYRLWIPKDQVALFEGQEDKLMALRARTLPAARRVAREVHKGTETNQQLATHKVKRGDSLANIASRYGVSIARLKQLNHLRSNVIRAGMTLKVEEAPVVARYRQYKVRRGDNLDVIAKRFNTTIFDLKKLNSLKRNTIFVGQVLKVGEQRLAGT